MDEALNCDRLAILRKGRLLIADTPEHILERGETAVTLCRQGREERLITSGKPEDVAAALAAYGLWQSISSVRVEPASLESVFLSLVDKEP
jgi:ABC-type multidrug transport system ATPase subunit